MNYLGLYASINPLISQLVSSLSPSSPSSSSSSSPRPSSNSLYMIRTVSTQKLPPKSSLHMLKVGLRERGHVYLQAINELANALCERYHENAERKTVVVYVPNRGNVEPRPCINACFA